MNAETKKALETAKAAIVDAIAHERIEDNTAFAGFNNEALAAIKDC